MKNHKFSLFANFLNCRCIKDWVLTLMFAFSLSSVSMLAVGSTSSLLCNREREMHEISNLSTSLSFSLSGPPPKVQRDGSWLCLIVFLEFGLMNIFSFFSFVCFLFTLLFFPTLFLLPAAVLPVFSKLGTSLSFPLTWDDAHGENISSEIPGYYT